MRGKTCEIEMNKNMNVSPLFSSFVQLMYAHTKKAGDEKVKNENFEGYFLSQY